MSKSKEEVEAVNEKLQELSKEELEQVNGGIKGAGVIHLAVNSVAGSVR